MNTIFIGLENPWGLLIAVKTGGYPGYLIISAEYGWDQVAEFEDNDRFEEVSPRDIPDAITNEFDFKRRYADRVSHYWVHKEKDAS